MTPPDCCLEEEIDELYSLSEEVEEAFSRNPYFIERVNDSKKGKFYEQCKSFLCEFLENEWLRSIAFDDLRNYIQLRDTALSMSRTPLEFTQQYKEEKKIASASLYFLKKIFK